MPHDPRLVKDEDKIEQLRSTIPDWIKQLVRPKTPCVMPAFGPLEGIRAVGTGQLIAQPYTCGKHSLSVSPPNADVTGHHQSPGSSMNPWLSTTLPFCVIST